MMLALTTTALVATALVAPPPASADPIPGLGQAWPRCGQAPDDDGRYCVVSVTRNGVPAPLAAGTTDGDYEVPAISLMGPGAGTVGNDLGLSIDHWLRQGVPAAAGLGNIDPDAVWALELNTGKIRATELTGNLRDVTQTYGGNATDGWTTTMTFRAVPLAWLSDFDACTFENGCGDETTVADWVYDGFVSARLSDGTTEGRPAWAVAARAGIVETGNAQGVATGYDFATNALVVKLVNPHLRSTGPDVAASGWFETFLPDTWLTANYHVPDPATLTSAAAFVVRRDGSPNPVSYTFSREAGGVWIRITDFSFSAPVFRVRPKPSAPGIPRSVRVVRLSAHVVKVAFRPPVADGGARITDYKAQCRRGDSPWQRASGPSSPLRVRNLPKSTVSCRVRAVNRIGASRWSGLHTG